MYEIIVLQEASDLIHMGDELTLEIFKIFCEKFVSDIQPKAIYNFLYFRSLKTQICR